MIDIMLFIELAVSHGITVRLVKLPICSLKDAEEETIVLENMQEK